VEESVTIVRAWLSAVPFGRGWAVTPPDAEGGASRPGGLAWSTLPRAAQLYVATVIVVGASELVAFFPYTNPRPALFAVLLIAACLTSVWKVNLPISLASGSTLSVSYAANLMSLLLLGPRHAMVVAVAGAWAQCAFKVKRRYPLYRTVFSMAAEAITMVATGVVYEWLGGPTAPFDLSALPKALVGAVATYFFVNTGLVGGAIAVSTGQPFGKVWRDDFLWSGASFMVAGSAGAVAAVIVERGQAWTAMLILAPVYLTYRTYELFVARLEDQRRHVAETRRLHQETVEALSQTRAAEHALADEKDRLAVTLADMTRLHESSTRLLKEHDLVAILRDVLEASIEFLNADKGLVQLYDEHDGVLKIAAHVGFDDEFLDLFKSVPPGFSVYGAALERRERVIVEDAFADQCFAAFAPVFASHDFIAMQSTPLMGSGGTPVGILSTHSRQPHRPTDHELRMLDLYAHQAERVIERKQTEELRNQLLEREQEARTCAEQANRLKDQFLATVSHELRTPLNAILGWADMLRRGGLDDARRSRAYRAIYDSGKRQAELIEDLLDVARIMSGKLQLERSAVDLNEIVRSALEIVQPSADAKRIQIALEADPTSGAFYGDGVRLEQIAWNLLSNAVKYTPDSGAVHVRLRRADDAVELAVTDTGQGIPHDLLQSVFERFRQADGSTTRPQGGLGLGLSIVKQLVELHGGTVSVESGGDGRGSTFTVRLPVARANVDESEAIAVNRSAPPSEPPNPMAALEGVSVLVVDDDDENREVVAAFLEDQHAVVLTAASAAQAFEVLQREHVHVLLADVAMPEEDGYALIRKVRTSSASEAASIPAVALTAFAREEDRQQALQAGFQVHLAKPIDVRLLVETIVSLRKLSPT
jgi:signal transduction histidine kinase/CheY-like chemotaxis protein